MIGSSLTLAARIVGCICLVGSMMIGTQISVDLLHFSNPAYANITKWSFESLDLWTVHHAHQFVNKESHLFAVGVYVVFYGVCSGLLVYATYLGQRLLTMPWLFCEGTCILCEASSLLSHYMSEKTASDRWDITGPVFCLAIATVMWCLVYEAQLSWKTEFVGQSVPSSPPPYSESSLEQPHSLHTPGRNRTKITVV